MTWKTPETSSKMNCLGKMSAQQQGNMSLSPPDMALYLACAIMQTKYKDRSALAWGWKDMFPGFQKHVLIPPCPGLSLHLQAEKES